MFSGVNVPQAEIATSVMEAAAKTNTNWWFTQWPAERDMDHANRLAKPTGPRKRPRLSDMLYNPPSFPRISARTMLVDAMDSTKTTWRNGERVRKGAVSGRTGGCVKCLRRARDYYSSALECDEHKLGRLVAGGF